MTVHSSGERIKQAVTFQTDMRTAKVKTFHEWECFFPEKSPKIRFQKITF